LAHAFGALWFVIIGLFLVGALGGLVVRDWMTPVIAGAALASAIVYLVFPTGATALEQGTTLFQVNLRYLMPAVALGMLLVPIIVHRRWPSLTPAVAFVFLGILLVAQLEPNVWGVQRARHAAFLLAGLCVLLAMCLLPLPVMRPDSPPTRRLSTTTLGVTVMVLAIGAGAFALERHYLARRYGSGEASTAGLAAVYRWAQHVADARIALYGAVTQYPLDGARVTNRVDYLGQHAPDGGYRPIPTCRLWKQTVDRGRYRYLVLTPAPTPAIPLDWTLSDPAITPVIHPAADVWVLRLHGALDPRLCS
jgi:hypothetical protein